MNMEQETSEKVEMVDLQGAVNEFGNKVKQRLEMLREGNTVRYHGQPLEYDGEQETGSHLIRLRVPGTEIITHVPAEMLAEDGWTLSQKEE